MDPTLNNPDPGSFMAGAGGGGSAILAAMQRRGMLPVSSQVGSGAPGASNQPAVASLPPQVSNGLPAAIQQPQSTPAQPQAPQSQFQQPVQPGTDEATLLIKALTDRLKHHSDVEKARSGIHPMQQPPTMPTVSGPAIQQG